MRIETRSPIIASPVQASGRISRPATDAPQAEPHDEVQLQPQSAAKKTWRKLEWASFAGQMVGGALVLAHQGPVGLGIFAASSAAMVYTGYKGQRA